MRVFVVFLCVCMVQFFIWSPESQAVIRKIKPKYIRSINVDISGDKFGKISDIFVDNENSEIFFLDYTRRRVVITSTEGTFLYEFRYKDAGLASPPQAIVVADDGNIYLAEEQRLVVARYNGKFLKEFDLSSIPGEFSLRSMVLEGDMLYLGDIVGHRVIVLDRKKEKFVKEYSKGFGQNVYIVLSEDMIYALDPATFGVYMVDRKTGKSRGRFGKVSSLIGGFSMPIDIAIDKKNKRIIVTDLNRVAVILFDYEGTILGEFGGDTMFLSLTAVAVGDDGRIYLSDGSLSVRVFDAIDIYAEEEAEDIYVEDEAQDIGFDEDLDLGGYVGLSEDAPEIY